MSNAWQDFRAGLPAFGDEIWQIVKRIAGAVYWLSLVMAALISLYGGGRALYAWLHPYTLLPPSRFIEGAELYALAGFSIALVRHITRLGRRAGGETVRPIPGAGIELRGGWLFRRRR